ncbi:ComEC/Rec2 family competence protein [Neobacillus drentensis]|uniref:ComEC/Rec2 family competence protein n=1 Tax=Neobacillus drentensis TaxID=220684 RepID=UPI002FFEC239
MSIHIKSLPAHDGDCFIISFGEPGSIKNIIVDGGRRKPVRKRLKEELDLIKTNNQKVDLLIVTHIDEDHIQGILKLFETDEVDKTIVEKVWFNSKENLSIYFNGQEQLDEKLIVSNKHNDGNISYQQGISFGKLLHVLGLSDKNLVFGGQVFSLGEAVIKVLSPDIKDLEKIYKDWEKEFPSVVSDGETISSKDTDYGQTIEQLILKPFKEDTQLSNGSSIAFSIEYKGKKMLMLGDSFPSTVIKYIRAFYLAEKEKVKIDLTKVSHHASKFNTNYEFLNLIDCKNYLVSTNGKSHGLPNKEALARILETSKTGNVKTKLFFNYPDYFSYIFSEKEMETYNFECIYLGTEKEDQLEV